VRSGALKSILGAARSNVNDVSQAFLRGIDEQHALHFAD
jgi:hypothetical protein